MEIYQDMYIQFWTLAMFTSNSNWKIAGAKCCLDTSKTTDTFTDTLFQIRQIS